MDLKIVDEENFKLEVKGETETITHLIARNVWELDGEAAAIKEHPFIEEPKIVVNAKNPKKILEKAAKRVQEQCDEFKSEFQKAMKK